MGQGRSLRLLVDRDERPIHGDIDFRWEVSGNAKQTLESRDTKEITFIPQDNKPVTVKARARVPVSGEDLGEASATLTVTSYDVKVEVLGTQGPPAKSVAKLP